MERWLDSKEQILHAAGEECAQSNTDAGTLGCPFFAPLAVFKVNCRATVFADSDGGDAAARVRS